MRVTCWQANGSEFLVEWLIANTDLSNYQQSGDLEVKELPASDASNRLNFHRMPARIKEILYLDSPDVIISIDDFPLLSVEISLEAGTGHNAFQRFSRIAAAVERGCAAIYIYPEATWVTRRTSQRWDRLNPLIFLTLESIMQIYDVPAFIYLHPSDFDGDMLKPPSDSSGIKGHRFDSNPLHVHCPDSSSSEMRELFGHVNATLVAAESLPVMQVSSKVLKQTWARTRRNWMQQEWANRNQGRVWSPETSTTIVPTHLLLDYLSQFKLTSQDFGDLLPSRDQTLLYMPDAKFRGDPYTGALAALDYLRCREGVTYEDRSMNLVIVWGSVEIANEAIAITGASSVDDYVEPVRRLYADQNAVLLSKSFAELKGKIPRYMMQVRHGTTYTKSKELRIYAYFADAILFPDGALWREA